MVLSYLNVQKNRIIHAEREKQLLSQSKLFLESQINEQRKTLHLKECKVQDLSLVIEEREQSILFLEEHMSQINNALRKHIQKHRISYLMKHPKPSSEKEEEQKTFYSVWSRFLFPYQKNWNLNLVL